MQKWKCRACLFLTGAVCYGGLELIYRRRTHWTMLLAGGICTLALSGIDKRMKKSPLALRAAMGAAAITAVEFMTGLIVNRQLGWDVWDYSRDHLNLLGQICPRLSLLWFLLCVAAMPCIRRFNDRVASKLNRA